MGLTPSQEQPRPTAIIPRDSPHFELLKAKAEDAHARTRTFKGTDADARLPEVRFGADARGPYSVIKAAIGGRPVPTYRLGMTGQHLAENSLAVLLALDTIGLDLEVTTRGLADLSAPSGRGAQTRFDTEDSPLLLIDEAYNANPASMARAIDTAAMVAGNDSTYRRLVLVLGDMLELGENASEFHLALKEAIAWRPDLVFACGPNMKLLWDSLPAEMRTPGGWQPTSAGLVEVVPAALRPGDVVMVKGSLGSRMAPIVEAIKMRFARSGD
jgi:UDP-N-acetylmuramoyl-tripeptide--D-alanyl-D-alanine ligase